MWCSQADDDDGDRAGAAELAVVWVEKARKGSVQWLDDCPEVQLKTYRLRKRTKSVIHLVMFIYLMLAVFEEPSWCIGDTVPCADQFKDMLSADIPLLPFQVTNTIEILCLCVFFLRAYLRVKSLGTAQIPGRWHKFGLAMLVISFVDCIISIFNIKGIVPGTFRIARLCRPFVFLSCFKLLRLAAGRVVRATRGVLNILASLAICVFLFVWIGIILFARTKEGVDHFDSWEEAFASMWILFTTSNNPDVWIDGYNSNRWTFVFIFVYLVISLYLLNNILLAAVYDAYKVELKSSLQTFFENRQTAIDHAFKLLAGEDGAISKFQWGIFWACRCNLNVGSASQQYHSQQSNRIFDALDSDGSGSIDEDEFKLVVEVLFNPSVYVPRTRPPDRRLRLPLFKKMHIVLLRGVQIRGRWVPWESLMDVLIFFDILTLLFQTIVFMDPSSFGGKFDQHIWTRGTPWFWVTFAISCFYFVEISLKLYLLGFERFWNLRPFQNPFDLINVYILFALELSFIFVDPPDTWIRISVIQHIFRVLRVLWHVRPLQQLAVIMKRLAPTCWRLMLLLTIVFYAYATVGEQVFGGLIRINSKALDGSDFANGNYYALNFNDFVSGMVTLFVLMVVNNWMIIADGFLKVTGTAWSQVFFVSFFVVVNLVVLNILMALILECYAALSDEYDQDQKIKRLRQQRPDSDGDEEAEAARRHMDREALLCKIFQEEALAEPTSPTRRSESASTSLSLHPLPSGPLLGPMVRSRNEGRSAQSAQPLPDIDD